VSLEDDIKAECRLFAIEWAISQLLASGFAVAGNPNGPLAFDLYRKMALQHARQQTYPRLGAAMSDLASAEKEAAIDCLLGYAKDFLDDMLRPDGAAPAPKAAP
jgi:hypothetical protein